MSKDNKLTTRTVHTLVLQAFVGPCPAGMEACHYDGDKANNKLGNLRWDTKRANELDAIRHRTRPDPMRTRCKYGHALTDDNVWFASSRPSLRRCKQCLKMYNARARAKRRES
jgi:HNH endonuclease